MKAGLHGPHMGDRMNEEKEAKLHQLIRLIANGSTTAEAAEMLQLTGRTARRWLKEGAPSGKKKAPKAPPINKNLVRKPGYSKFAEPVDTTLVGWRRFVISSIQNDVPIDKDFLAALRFYCKRRKAKLILIPVDYCLNAHSVWPVDELELYRSNVSLSKHLKLMAAMPVSPTIVESLAGLASLSKGSSMIIGHPQICKEGMASYGTAPAEMHTTGSISRPQKAYSHTKTGEKAKINHSLAALVVELGQGDSHFVRVLNGDKSSGFFDCGRGDEGYYSKDGFAKLRGGDVEVMVTGDEHAAQADPLFVEVTYTRKDSMSEVMRPKRHVRHDLLDFMFQNHHDMADNLRRVAKHLSGVDRVEDELVLTSNHLRKTKKPWAEDIIVSSNHDEAFYKWLTTVNIKNDVLNAKLYFKMNWLMLDNLETNSNGGQFPNPFKLWMEHSEHAGLLKTTRFLGSNESYRVCGVEFGLHGHHGANGARGSLKGFAAMPFKVSVGHGHTSGINKGAQMGGHGTKGMAYMKGASSWTQTNGFLYKNGTRQQTTIINGEWRGPALT